MGYDLHVDRAVSGPVSISLAQRAGVLVHLAERFDVEEDVLVTGGAYGVDTTATIWALGEGMPVTLVVPEKQRWNERLMDNAGVTVVVVPSTGRGPSADYMARNEEIAERAATLVAFPYTKREHARSGTWATARRFDARGKGVFIIPLSQFT